jgi:hypothetical protein
MLSSLCNGSALFPPVLPDNAGLPFDNSTPQKSARDANIVIDETPMTRLMKVAFPDNKENQRTHHTILKDIVIDPTIPFMDTPQLN